MNYLAHLALSEGDEEVLSGNFIGDSLRGIDVNEYPPKIQLGIRLHRFIDSFTDHHPLFIEAKKIFSSKFDKYSGAIVDICFDHFLAKNFLLIYHIELQQFAFSCYRDTGKFFYMFPEKAQQFYQYMVQNNILFNYSTEEGIEKVLTGMTFRLGERILLYEAYPIFLDNYKKLEEIFFKFFPELQHACKNFLDKEFGRGGKK